MLHNVKILDLTRVLAGPHCAMTLGDLGADVIKVERPGDGDESRGWGPPFDENGESAYFICCNRNKLSIALDLDSESDRSVLGGLIRGASVVLDNFRPGTLERKGIDPLSMLTECHSLVWCTLTGFGLGSTRPGYDYVVQAEAGWMSITGPEQGPPMKVGVALADVISGKDAVIGVLAALHAVSTGPRSPDQRRITVSLSGSAKAALVNVAQNYLVSGSEPKRWGNAHPNLVPYQLFQAADRGLVVAVGNDGQWRQCCAALELPDLGADAALATNSGRLANRQRVIDAISARLVERRAGEWQAVLDRVGVPCGVVRSVPEALGGAEASALTGIAPSVPGSVRLPPPRLDEHGALIRAHGWGAFERVERLGPLRQAT